MPSPKPGVGTVAGVLLNRLSDPDGFHRWQQLGDQVGWCRYPIRVAGHIMGVDPVSGGSVTAYDTAHEPDRVLLLACGNRRERVCPPCSRRYQLDTWVLAAAGLRGGKGVPAEVESFPRVFLTATAPGFGSCHRGGSTGACCPIPSGLCVHGRAKACLTSHRGLDPVIGAPICVDCFDYRAAVLFNALSPQLWARTVIAVRRELARITGISVRETEATVRLSYMKVAEFQKRGLIHYHAICRLDARTPAGQPAAKPPPPFDQPELLAAAIRIAITATTMPTLAAVARFGLTDVRWGPQADVRIIAALDPEEEGSTTATRSGAAVSNYLAKYVTKDISGNRVTYGDCEDASGRGDTAAKHYQRLRATCSHLACEPALDGLNLTRRIETFGYPSRPTSRSRAFSTTMAALRAERQAYVTQSSQVDPNPVAQVSQWRYVGRGWNNPGEAAYAGNRAAERLAAYGHSRDLRRDPTATSADTAQSS